MRWNCPHCRLNLEAADSLVGTHWRFSLCPKCMRFGLLRIASPNTPAVVVKVDRAPQGEEFIRATTSEAVPLVKPATQRSATQTSTRLTIPTRPDFLNTNPRIEVKQPDPVQPEKTEAKDSVAPPTEAEVAPQVSAPVEAVAPVQAPKPATFFSLPEPLPEVPEAKRSLLPGVVLLGCLSMLVWNGFRYWSIREESRVLAREAELNDRMITKAMAPTREESTVQKKKPATLPKAGDGL